MIGKKYKDFPRALFHLGVIYGLFFSSAFFGGVSTALFFYFINIKDLSIISFDGLNGRLLIALSIALIYLFFLNWVFYRYKLFDYLFEKTKKLFSIKK